MQIYIVFNDGGRTEWSPILSVIIQESDKLDDNEGGV